MYAPAAQALYAGAVDGTGPQPGSAEYEAWRADTTTMAQAIGGVAGFLLSSSEAANVSAAADIARSGFENNYLTHAEELMRIQAQIDCSQGDQASCETFADLQQLDADRDEFLAGCIGNYSDDCRGIRSHLTRTVAEYVEIAQQLDNAGISSDPTAGLPGYGMERKEALFQFSTYADVNDEFDFSDLVSTDMQSSLARSILQGDLSSATITSVNMLAAADVMQLGAEAGSGILIPLPPGAALSASAMLQIEFGMDVLDAFGLGGGFTSVGGGNIRSSTGFDQRFGGRFSNQAEADEAFKQYEIAKNANTEIVLGRLHDTQAGAELGMTRLDSGSWTPNVNDLFVQGGIDAGKPFYLGSNPDISNYRAAWNALEGNRGNYPQTIFFREMKQLRDAGYRLVGDNMLPPN
ncbi:hypothetical protein N9491_07170, partial [Planktomarina temperata]|nr:hypothetical protein [Planktomarina temperata]